MSAWTKIRNSVTKPLKKLQDWLLPTPEQTGLLIEKSGTNNAYKVAYGITTVPAIKIFKMTSDKKGGPWNDYLHLICVFCEGEVDAIEEIYFNDVPSAQIDSKRFHVEKFLGSDTQNHCSSLTREIPSWKSTATLNGLCYAYVRLQINKKQDWWQGEPQIKARIRGRKIKDIRTGEVKYSSNPALILWDYLTNSRFGKATPESELNLLSFKEAADYCDEGETFSEKRHTYRWDPELRKYISEGFTIVTTTNPRMTCNYLLDTDKKILDNVKEIRSGCRGLIIPSENGLRFDIEKGGLPKYFFDASNLRNEKISSKSGSKNRYHNRVTVRYPSAQILGQFDEVSWPEKDSDIHNQWLQEDKNIPLDGSYDFPTINNAAEALQMAEVVCRRSRYQRQVKIPAQPWAIEPEAGDIVALTEPTHGYVKKAFLLLEKNIKINGDIDYDAIEHQDSIYVWSVSEVNEHYPDTSLALPSDILAPTGFSFTETPNNDNRQGFLSWSDPNNSMVSKYRIEIYQSSQLISSDETSDFSYDLDSLSVGTYQLKLYALNSLFISPAATKTITLSIPGTNYQGFGDPTFSQGLKKWSSTPTGEHVNSLVGAPDFSVMKTGKFGGNSIEIKNTKVVFSRDVIPVETDKHYRLRFRVRQTQTQTTGGSSVYAGVCCLDENFLHYNEGSGSYRYACALNNSLAVGSGWQEFKGIITGIGSSSGNFKSYTKYVRPMFIVNYSGGNGVVEVDYLTFEEVPDIDLIKIGTGWIELPAPGADVTNYEDIRISNAVAQAAAEDYTDALTELAEENAKAHADNVVTAAEARSLEAAQAKVAAAEARLEAFADNKVTLAEARAIAAADAKAVLAETTAKAYADGIVTDAEQRAIDAATEKANTAELNAKGYIDGQLAGFVSSSLYAGEMAALQAQVDKAITTWFLSGVPTLSNAPANTWTTNDDKNTHLGDLYYDNNTEYAYRFKINGSVYEWKKINDSDLTKALADAAKAQDTADSKRRVFVAQPITPYDDGDLWDTGSGIKRSTVNRTSGPFVSGDWRNVADVTDYDSSLIANHAVTLDPYGNLLGAGGGAIDLVNSATVEGGLITYGTNKYSTNTTAGGALINDANATDGLARAIWKGWTSHCYVSAASGKPTLGGLKPGRQYRMYCRARKVGTLNNMNLFFYNSTKAGSVPIDSGTANAFSRLTADYQVIELVTFTHTWGKNDNVYFGWGSSSSSPTNNTSNCMVIDWLTIVPVDIANETIIGSQAKADAAQAAAEAVAETKAELARTTAEAHADGIVTAAEQRAIADAQDKADAAYNAAIDALKTINLFAVQGSHAVAGNSVSSNGVSSWLSGAKSSQSHSGGAVAEWTNANSSSAYYMAGLSDSTVNSGHYQQVDFALYAAGSAYLIYIRGSHKHAWPSLIPKNGDVCRVTYDGDKVYFYVNGVRCAYVYDEASDDLNLHFRTSVHSNGGKKTLKAISLNSFANYKVIAEAAEAKAELARITAAAYADGIVTAAEQRNIADATEKANMAQQLAQERAQLTQSNQTLYSINGISPDVMPTGSPFALGFSGTTGFSHFSPLSDLIPVKKGETLHWEMWARQTGNTVRAYMGIERYDRNKKHIGSNSGTVYGGLVNHTLSTAWTKYTASHTLPETHTPYNGSDGRECCFVRVRLLFNYQTTGQAYYSGYRLYRVQDQQYMPNLVAAGAGTALSANPLSAIDNGSTAKINIASHTRQYGFGLITLNAGSISGLGFNTKYYVYYDDPNYTGGTMTYRATTNLQTVAASNHRIYVSAIVTPSNGGGGTKPPVEWCVTLDMWLTQQLQAANVSETDTLDLWWDGKESVKGKVLQAKAIPDKQVVYEIETSSGAIVRISESTPLELENHTIITPKALVVNQDELATLKGDSKTLVWEKVIRADIIGEQHVMHISVGDGCFAAGLDASNRIITHNGQEKP